MDYTLTRSGLKLGCPIGFHPFVVYSTRISILAVLSSKNSAKIALKKIIIGVFQVSIDRPNYNQCCSFVLLDKFCYINTTHMYLIPKRVTFYYQNVVVICSYIVTPYF